MMVAVKICGLSEPVTLQAALEAGADMVGFVFYERSPRNVGIEQAASLANMARGKAAIVALVVDADDKALHLIAQRVRPDFIQAHGNETPGRVLEIQKLTGIRVIKAIKVLEASDVASAKAYHGKAALILFDAKAPENLVGALPGGNGISFDWKLLNNTADQFMLSGGLNPDNVSRAIAATHAPIVDVSSGVESSPGVKDISLIWKFIERAKAAG
ncbi:MAG: phosphoribosylanthranilate isomerase [Alphaproteobacteria bacterium]|nr:phosphoribosylanthranilate isomerase [Alphaproteobacteria bacterium]